jgi:hypothetical protein
VNEEIRRRYLADYPRRLSEYLDPARTPEQRGQLRNEIVTGLLAADEYDFQSYAARAALYQRTAAVGSEFAVLALTTGATMAAGEQAKSALAGLAAAVASGRVAFDKEVFYDTAFPALLERMQALRARKREAIEAKLATLSNAQYPLNAAVLDVLDYYRHGTLAAAIADVARQTEQLKSGPAPMAMTRPSTFSPP